MAIHVQDDEADRMIRDFARRRGVGITAAIKLAVREADSLETGRLDAVLRRIQPLINEVKAKRRPTESDDKAFMDEMWGEES